jgi:hypothetical protein
MNIKYKPMITITADELDRIITEKYPEAPIEIANDLFYGEFVNDCYKSLDITDNYCPKKLGPYYDYLFKTLREAFPGQDHILVDVTW